MIWPTFSNIVSSARPTSLAPWHKWSRRVRGYRRALQALQTYTELAKKDDGELLPPLTKAIVPGDAYPGTPRLTRLLRLVGDLPAAADVSAGGTIYDAALVDAVKKFQGRHGRDPNGRIGANTGRLERSREPPGATNAISPGAMEVDAGGLPTGTDHGEYPRIPP